MSKSVIIDLTNGSLLPKGSLLPIHRDLIEYNLANGKRTYIRNIEGFDGLVFEVTRSIADTDDSIPVCSCRFHYHPGNEQGKDRVRWSVSNIENCQTHKERGVESGRCSCGKFHNEET